MIHNTVFATVEFDKNQGQIILDIESGFSSIGFYNIFSLEPGNPTPVELFVADPKKINDNIPDSFVLPFNFNELINISLIISGKYGPAPLHNQIKVTYIFNQLLLGNITIKELDITPKDSNKIRATAIDPFDRFMHIFTFQEAN